MARPKNKTELQELSARNYEALLKLISSYEEDEQNKEFPEGTMNRNIRDLVAHLHHWHLMIMEWYKIGMSGEKPEMPAKGHSWKTTPQLNKEIWEMYSGTPLKEALQSFSISYIDIRQIIDRHSDEELFTKKKYKWTGSTSLGAYLVSATSSHYDWAIKLIKKAKK